MSHQQIIQTVIAWLAAIWSVASAVSAHRAAVRARDALMTMQGLRERRRP